MPDPITLSAEADPRSDWQAIAYVGEFEDAGRYGRFSISRSDVESWIANLSLGLVTGEDRVAVDYSHSLDNPGADPSSRVASGWIRELRLAPDGAVQARIQWTRRGREAIESGELRYLSATFASHFKDERGVDRGPTLLGAALGPHLHRWIAGT